MGEEGYATSKPDDEAASRFLLATQFWCNLVIAMNGMCLTNELENIALVIFDCDGVLIDSEPLASRTLAEMLQEAGISIDAREAHVRFTGNSEPTIRRICEEEFGLTDVDARFEAWHENLYREFGRSLRSMPGMDAVVASINRPKCVASNSSPDRLQKSLGRLDLWEHFYPAVFSAQMVARPKPAADLVLLCAEKFQVRPEHCVMIDDSPHGIVAAVEAGAVAIGFVDPADPRPDRASLLMASGASFIANGAAELLAAISAGNNLLGEANRVA